MHPTRLFLLLALLAGCDTYTQDTFQPDYVVEAYLIAGEPLPLIRLSTTAPIDSEYSLDEQHVRQADIVVSLLDEAGGVANYHYAETPAGVYVPVEPTPTVLAGRRYALEITTADGQHIAAGTQVPGDFDLFAPPRDTIVYQQESTFQVEVTESSYPDRSAIYILKLRAGDTTQALTPLYASWVEDEEVTREELIDNNSGILNEANFERVDERRLRVVLPWIAVAYYGENEVVVDAIDDNLYDFVRTREDNGTRPFGERENSVDHIDGGRGIFGSLARRHVPIYISP